LVIRLSYFVIQNTFAMKTKRLLFLLTGVIVACNQGAFDTGLNGAVAQRQSTYADCKAALYQAPQRIINGQLNCPNPCLYTHEGFINFKENRVQLNCQQYPWCPLDNFWLNGIAYLIQFTIQYFGFFVRRLHALPIISNRPYAIMMK
jgi:hypothetical protein